MAVYECAVDSAIYRRGFSLRTRDTVDLFVFLLRFVNYFHYILVKNHVCYN